VKSLLKSKTVYVLGAGFSYGGGLPLQTQILERILNYDFDILSGDKPDYFIQLSKLFLPQKKSLKEFLDKVFSSNQIPSLEDVFTLLDQTIAQRSYCLGYSWLELNSIREALKYAILIIFHDAAERLKEEKEEFYKLLATFLIDTRIKANLKNDPFSIISLNWDTLLEDSIYWCLNRIKGIKRVDVDYCCYTTPIGKNCPHTPSLVQKAKKIYNIKILKLHGSANWLLCPNCDRLYTGIGSKENVWDLYALPRYCHNCRKLNETNALHSFPKLEPFFITPTFAKVFDNTHIQMIWHNAHVELAEANKVVFIGYSLPEADYHLRTLIRRAIRSDTRIDVVLRKSDRPTRSTKERIKKFYAVTRYRDFFGSGKINFYLEGVKSYFTEDMGKGSLRAKLQRLHNRL
jgi:hypothetical protein